MKKYILMGLSALILCGCGESVSQELVKRYETMINTKLKEGTNQLKEMYNVELEMPDFSCKTDKNFIKCTSNNIAIFYKEPRKEKYEIFSIKSIEYDFNEIYKGENKGLISIQDYYNELFKDNKKLETSLNIKGIRLSQDVIENTKIKDVNFEDIKVKNLIIKLIQEEYNLNHINYTTLSNKALKYDFSQKFYNTKNSLNLNYGGSVNLKEEGFTALEKELEVKFNTQTLNYERNSTNELSKVNFDLLLPQLPHFISINDLKFNFSLDTENALQPYVDILKSSLELQKNTSKDEQETLKLDKILTLLEDIIKNPVYNIDINAQFKDILLKDYQKEGVEVIEKITINGKDFTDILKKNMKDILGRF
ncbi:JlpA family lipoprotein adhesin [Campylobacter cuniculorum]|uniref:Uncharacterized protein n=2 Tax=Campylobacter cuniculorum TaxID=374106 RepID=A0ABX6TVN4_9BACT|nr:JlpA family lipoprotein adhesin [Campylobacter cuniculorum]ARJ56361.1 putative surface-exposed lipoprotein adhesin JlpA [Campylobacter cuniculorum DSM 23162 = LMG 24588]QOR03849.1 hypothetical protein A0071_06635 [Campylobacter cuniculorum]